MTEQLKPQESKGEQLTDKAEARAESQQESHQEKAERSQVAEKVREAKLEEARSKIHEEAGEREDPLTRLQASEKDSDKGGAVGYVDATTRNDILKKQLQHLQRKLPVADRALSKVIHQPVVRAISETAGKTVSRPSGLLGGGLVAFIGSTGYLILAKHLGFTYNSFVFILLFIIGFLIGLGLELAVWAATASHRRTND